MKTIILATGNKDKAKELEAMLGRDFDVRTMRDIGIDVEIIEDGSSFEENARIKVKTLEPFVSGKDVIVMGDDSGLCIDFLDGRPGIYSARYAGENASYEDNNQKLLKELAGVPEEKRGATFVSVIAMLLPDGRECICEGRVRGKIAFDFVGCEGFGYDPLFIHAESGRCYAEMDKAEKNRLSHRAQAMTEVKTILENAFKPNGDA